MSRAFIIDPTVGAIEGLYALLGIGIPNDGGVLYSSLEFFEKALEDLASAFPGDGWLGSAADKYSGKNRDHVNFFQELADLDRQLISLIKDQASAVKTTRDILDGAKRGLEYVRPVAVDLTYVPIVGYALSAAFQAPLCAAAMAVVGGALAYLTVKTLINAARLVGLLAKLAQVLAAAIADVISDVVDIIKGILEEVWEFITGAINGLKEIWDKLTWWISNMLSNVWSGVQSFVQHFFSGIPGLSGMTSGLSQVTGLFSSAGMLGSAGMSGSSGLTSASNLASAAGLTGLPGFGALPQVGQVAQVAQVRAASTSQPLRPRTEGLAETATEQPAAQHAQTVSAHGSQGTGGAPGMGGMHPASGAGKGATTKKYSEGAAAGTEDAERAPVEAETGGGKRVLVRNVV
ncbi:EspA/EspE family type VII secretion system effector [Mycobacterium decipiens]|uniref:Secretion protein EspA n=1 Tax=Mycobacterium decipiens TaxID=1430326 RepID=A0A1X2LUQ1_9MYCO|nr:EspA/EspE family type VII secretion system effector [Mycobacterium decipiens]OSC40603.1 secretion protein EspA [Mycobacterium decipiens]